MQEERSEELEGGTQAASLRQLAADAAIWGVPLVSFDDMRQGMRRDAGARYGDVVFISRPADWRFQGTTPNATTYYVISFFDLKGGPVVLEIPPAAGAGLFGSLLDAWQLPVADVGPAGEDEGKGARYLLLPPGYREVAPAGYLPVQFRTVNGYMALRAIPEGSSEPAVEKALELVKKVRMYPLSKAAAPPTPRFIDMWGKRFECLMHFDVGFFESLARMVEEEPALTADASMLERLERLGIARGRPFAPDAAMKEVLSEAADEVHRDLIRGAASQGALYWPGTQWREIFGQVHPETGFVSPGEVEPNVRERAIFYFLVIAPPNRPGRATLYLSSFFDAAGQPLDGSASYRLHVPADVPAAQFWASTVYAVDTAGFIRDAARVELGTFDPVQKNADGSVDLFFGPEPPAGRESNWISTAPGQGWFTLFRFYGPQPALFDKSWRMGDIERLPGDALH